MIRRAEQEIEEPCRCWRHGGRRGKDDRKGKHGRHAAPHAQGMTGTQRLLHPAKPVRRVQEAPTANALTLTQDGKRAVCAPRWSEAVQARKVSKISPPDVKVADRNRHQHQREGIKREPGRHQAITSMRAERRQRISTISVATPVSPGAVGLSGAATVSGARADSATPFLSAGIAPPPESSCRRRGGWEWLRVGIKPRRSRR